MIRLEESFDKYYTKLEESVRLDESIQAILAVLQADFEPHRLYLNIAPNKKPGHLIIGSPEGPIAEFQITGDGRLVVSNKFAGNHNIMWDYIRDINGAQSYHRQNYDNPDINTSDVGFFTSTIIDYYTAHRQHIKNKFEFMLYWIDHQLLDADGNEHQIDHTMINFDPGNNKNMVPNFNISLPGVTYRQEEKYNTPLNDNDWYILANSQGKQQPIDIKDYIPMKRSAGFVKKVRS